MKAGNKKRKKKKMLKNYIVFRRGKKIPDWLYLYKTVCSEICFALRRPSSEEQWKAAVQYSTQGSRYRSPSLHRVKGTEWI